MLPHRAWPAWVHLPRVSSRFCCCSSLRNPFAYVVFGMTPPVRLPSRSWLP